LYQETEEETAKPGEHKEERPPKKSRGRGRKPKIAMLPTPGLIKRKRGRPAKNEVYAQRQAERQNMLKQGELQSENEEDQMMNGSEGSIQFEDNDDNMFMRRNDSLDMEQESIGEMGEEHSNLVRVEVLNTVLKGRP
jgi:hypothetical protein